MGRAKGGANGGEKRKTKSQEVRELLAANPKMKVRTIVEELASRGIKITPSQVYLVKRKWKMRKRRAAQREAVATGQRVGVKNPAELVLEVKRLAGSAGGLQNLRMLVEALAD